MDKRERVARAIAGIHTLHWDIMPEARRKRFFAYADVAIAALEPMDKPRVKPLVWVRCEGETAFVALTSVKTYRLKWVPDFHVWTLDGRPYENVSIAKAAAQADYESRILAALEPVTVRVCAKCGHPENDHPYKHPFASIAQKDADSGC